MAEQTKPIVEITMKDGGKMTAELYPEKAPITVANFVDLIQRGFFDGVTFHRVVEGFVIQGGSPSGSCAGEDIGFTIEGEFAANGVKNDLKHTRGALSMARTMVMNSASSQFFIVHQDAPHLDGEYAAFGLLIDGFDVLDRIASAPTDGMMNTPYEPQVMEKVTVRCEGYTPEVKRLGELLEQYQ